MDKIKNKPPSDPIDRIIFEKGIRVEILFIYKKLDLFLVILNNGNILKLRLSNYSRLEGAKDSDLSKWKLIGGGTGIHWEHLNEDLSLKGLIKEVALENALENIIRDDDDKIIA